LANPPKGGDAKPPVLRVLEPKIAGLPVVAFARAAVITPESRIFAMRRPSQPMTCRGLHKMSRQMVLGLLVAAILSGCFDGSSANYSASGATTVAAGTGSTPAAAADPCISGTPLTSVVIGNAYDFTPTTTNPSGAALTFNVKNAPSWATFNSATGELSGTPTAADVSTYSNITISVSDGATSVSLPAFQIAVTQIANGGATLSWAAPTENTDGTPLTNLAGYEIYYGTSVSAMTHTVQIANAGIVTYVISNLSPGTWYFSVKAYTSAKVQSSASAMVSKTID